MTTETRPGPGTGAGGGPGDARSRAEAGGARGPWTILELIRWSADYLMEKGVESGRLDAEHLLAHALGTGRLQLYLEYDRPLEPDELDAFRPLLRRRARREPLQYILGRAAFRELELAVDPRALIPRPETEELVERVLAWARESTDLTAVDVGTGTGCIALSLLTEGPFREVWGVDASADALALARENAREAGVDPDAPGDGRLRLVLGEGLAPLPRELQVDVVVSNPPYIPQGEAPTLQAEVRDHEPWSALFAGEDGLAVVRPLVADAPVRLRPGGLLALELAWDQPHRVQELVESTGAFHRVEIHRDLSGRPRILTAVRDHPGGGAGGGQEEASSPGGSPGTP